MQRYVIMVDAGYLLRQTLEIVSNKASTSRLELEITDPAALIQTLLDKAAATLNLANKELLRVYWYDGVPNNGFTPQQRLLMDVDDVQLRAGMINGLGRQKGVDSLIMLDLLELSANHAICDAVLVTGDGDLAEGMELAQKRGVRIAVLGVGDASRDVHHNQSFDIINRADRAGLLGHAELSHACRYVPLSEPAHSTPHTATDLATEVGPFAPYIRDAVQGFINQQNPPLTSGVVTGGKHIEQAINDALIRHVSSTLGNQSLTQTEKVYARRVFIDTLL